MTMTTAKDIMTTEVITLTPETDIVQAAKVLLDNGINGAPVVDGQGRLTGILCQSDLVARLGGDEFVAFVDNVDGEALKTIVEAVKNALDAYNATAKKPYRITVCVGYDVRSDRYSEIEDFIRHVDHLMYRDKQNRHASADSGAGQSTRVDQQRWRPFE